MFIDGLLNDYETFGSANRFLRSLRIGAMILCDYGLNLRNLKEGTEEYNEVLHNFSNL